MRTSPFASMSVGLACAACSGGGLPEVKSKIDRDDAPSTENLPALVASNTAFAVELYQFAVEAAAAEGGTGNVFLSPHSITSTLAMTYAGATGATATQIADALHFDLPPAELHEALNALDRELDARGQSSGGSIPFQLKSANAVFGQVDYPIGGPFLDTLALNYGAGVYVVDYNAAEDARSQINGWVADNTDGKIENLIPEGLLNNYTRLVLTNAMYFAAAWTDPFDSDDTVNAVFHAPGGDVMVPTMHQSSADLAYGQGPRFRAVELPYDGDEVSMVVVLPELLDGETGDPLALLEAELSAAKIAEITASLQDSTELQVALPKFTFRATFPLTDALKAFGMIDAFDPELADFTPINPEPRLHVWRALHEGFIQVDEEGTRAAAATAVVIGDDSAPPSIEIDRPFLMMIRDRATGQILFMGRVLDPREV